MTSGVDRDPEPGLSACADHPGLLRIAFGDRPDAPARLQPDATPVQRWLAAVALGAAGRYGAAAAAIDSLTRDHRLGNRVVRAHAAVTRAAHLRQAGGHLAARRWDALGLALATSTAGPARADSPPGLPDSASTTLGADPGLDRAAARADALLGLAADAIGLADLGLADRLLHAAQPVALDHPSWRPGVRWHWVSAELSLCRDRPGQAADLAGIALRAAQRAGATRHQVKSALVLAVAEAEAGEDRALMIRRLTQLSEWTRKCGLLTLEWPTQLQLATLAGAEDPERGNMHRRQAMRIVGRIQQLADPFVRSVLDHSPWVPRLVER